MAEENEKRLKNEEKEEKVLPHDGREGPVDSYTGEVEPPAPDAYKISEIL